MMVLPPVAAAQAGQASGGGMLDSFKAAMSGGTGTAGAPPAQTSQGGDGSVGLFDGVLKKTLLGGAAGAVIGFIPFIPGGPILGGVMGALGGAALGVFSNWRKIQSIKAENEAMLAAMGVQADDPQVKEILKSGNVSQLIPLMQQQAAGVQQGGVGQTGVGQGATQAAPAQQGPNIQQVTDPATGVTRLIDVSSGRVVEDASQAATQQTAGIATGALPQVVDPGAAPSQSPVPTQGSIAVGSGGTGAINPNATINPGVAPANQYASGGGGSAGDAGRPPAPAGSHGSNAAAIAPTQAGIGMPASGGATATEGVGTLADGTATLDRSQLTLLIHKLQQQIEQIKAFLAEQERTEQLDKAAAR